MQTDKLQEVFSHRQRPVQLIGSAELTDDEVTGIKEIGKHIWQDLSFDILERYPDAINLMAPSAFLYYLPGIIQASVREGCRNAVAVVTVVSMLDRTPDSNLWDNHFIARWPKFTGRELSVVSDWILWLEECGDFALDEISLIRSLETLDLLRRNQALSE